MCPIACSHYLHQRSCQWKIDLKRLVFPSCETHMLWISSVACILDKKFLYALSHTCSPRPLVGSAPQPRLPDVVELPMWDRGHSFVGAPGVGSCLHVDQAGHFRATTSSECLGV